MRLLTDVGVKMRSSMETVKEPGQEKVSEAACYRLSLSRVNLNTSRRTCCAQ